MPCNLTLMREHPRLETVLGQLHATLVAAQASVEEELEEAWGGGGAPSPAYLNAPAKVALRLVETLLRKLGRGGPG